MIRCSALSAPTVMSVPTMSLSIEPTIPAMIRWECRSACSCVISPASTRAARCSVHSLRKRSVPDSDPSPPQTTIRSMPWWTMFRAALSRPSRVRKSAERAVPMTVPPRWRIEPTEPQENFRIRSPPSTRPCRPSYTA